jgi:heptosyltransferase-2
LTLHCRQDILIVKCQALGDVLRTTSLLKALRRSGRREISWATSRAALPLLENNALLKEAFPLPFDDVEKLERLKKKLHRRFGLVLSLEEHPQAAQLAQEACGGELVGVTWRKGRLGYTPSSALYYDMSLLNRDEDGGLKRADALKASNRKSYAELWLKILGLPLEGQRPQPILHLLAEDRETARRLARRPELRHGKIVLGLNPGAGKRWPAKQIPEEKAAGILAALGRNFNASLLLLGGGDETERNRRIAAAAKALKPDLKLFLPGSLPLRRFAALIERCDALVTTDSLALHMATALKRPALALVGPTSAAELDFYGRGRALKPPQACRCFYKSFCQSRQPCLGGIAEKTVVDGVLQCLR